MKTGDFLDVDEVHALKLALARVDQNTTGTVRVHISERVVSDALVRAIQRFDTLKLANTPQRNAVLIYFAPLSRRFAVVGDEAIHKLCGQVYWDQLAAKTTTSLQRGTFGSAVLKTVAEVESLLATHFPKPQVML